MSVLSKAVYTFFFSVSVILSGCVDGGNPPNDDSSQTSGADIELEDAESDNADGVCLYRTTVLDSLESESVNVGYRGADLLALFEGEQLHHAVYAEENEVVEQSPLGGDTILLLSVSYDDGEIRDIEGKTPSCGHYLEMDVNVEIKTSDTAFAEEVSGVLYFYKNEVEDILDVRLYAVLDPGSLEGGFEIARILEPASSDQLMLYLVEAIDNNGAYQGSLVVRTGDGEENLAESQYYQNVLSWQTMIVL